MISAEQNVRHVLVADDDDEDYLILSIAFEELKYTVLLSRVMNGDALMKALNEHVPDILLLDIMMPFTHGNECLKSIRADQRFDSLPIIMYTSIDDLSTIEFCYREGANLYVLKPHSIGDLKDMLQRILSINWKKTFYFPPRDEFVIR